MSHYAVAVFTDGTKSVEELLEPFSENIEVEPYISRTRQQLIQDGREDVRRYLAKHAEREPDAPRTKELLSLSTDEDFYNYAFDDSIEHDEEGNEISTYNPDSKWDWYSIGGRWETFFDKFGIDPDGTKVSDINTTPDSEAYEKAIRLWEIYIDGEEPQDQSEEGLRHNFYRKEYYQERYQTKECYAQCMSSFSPFAALTPDGIWHEPGPMGWFGCSGETPEDGRNWELNFVRDYIETADPDWVMTIVDCHI